MSTRQVARNKRRDARNVHAPKGKHWCHYHPNKDGEHVGAYLPKANFNKNHTKVHGLDDKCRDCAKLYRQKYEAIHGKRQDKTKTLRVSPAVHSLAKEAAKRTGAAVYQYVGAALKFYIAYGCQHPGCIKPKSKFGKCDDHVLAVVTTEESA